MTDIEQSEAKAESLSKLGWEQRFLLEAHLKSLFSKDPSTKVGAVIVDPVSNTVISSGWNGPARGVDDTNPKRFQRPEKYFWFCHAEENAILNAARNGVRTDETEIYVTHPPCAHCARKIIQAGIRTVHVDRQNVESYIDANNQHGFHQAMQMFSEASVEWVQVNREFVLTVESTHV